MKLKKSNKNEIFILNNHSFVDVITNSSSELFVCDSDKSLKIFKELLNELIKEYNTLVQDKDLEYFKQFKSLNFFDTYKEIKRSRLTVNLDQFENPYIYTRQMYLKMIHEHIEHYSNDIPYCPDVLLGYECVNFIGKIILQVNEYMNPPELFWYFIHRKLNGQLKAGCYGDWKFD